MGEKYLSEERYQQNKKKLGIISLVVLVIGLSVGGFLIYKGITRNSSSGSTNRLSEIKEEKEKLKKQIDEKEYECDSLDMGSSTWYQDKNRCNREVMALNSELSALKSEEFELNSSQSNFRSIPYYIFGGFIIFASCMFAGSIYMITKRREILAFGVQQVMPLVEEGAEKIAPIAGKTMDTMAPHIGNVAKEISKGIHEGKKDSKK